MCAFCCCCFCGGALQCHFSQFEKVANFFVGQALSYSSGDQLLYRSTVYVHTDLHVVFVCFRNPQNYDVD